MKHAGVKHRQLGWGLYIKSTCQTCMSFLYCVVLVLFWLVFQQVTFVDCSPTYLKLSDVKYIQFVSKQEICHMSGLTPQQLHV